MTQIDFQQASECFPALAELVAKGEEILIVKDNLPFIKLVPIKPAQTPPLRERARVDSDG